MTDENRLIIFDTTLRDGEQSPGASMNLAEKIHMAQQLELLGVDIIEAGFAATSPGDFESVATISREVSNLTVASLSRCAKVDIDKSAQALKDAKKARLHLVLATSPLHMEQKLKKTPEEVLRMTEENVRYAASFCKDIEFSCEDASRSEIDFLVEVCNVAIEAGATTLNIPDTVGYAMPAEFGSLITELKQRVRKDKPVIFSVHCHNDLGLAVAGSLAAVKAGARQVEVTIGGIGERAGNATLEEVVMALNVRKDYYNVTTGIDTKQIYATTRRLFHIIGQPIPRNKPITGANAFAHESGIHQAGVLANPLTYEIMTPESVGVAESSIILGKHSGRNAIKSKLEKLGHTLTADQVDIVFDAVKVLADRKKEIFDEDLESIVLENFYRTTGKQQAKYELVHFGLHSSDSGVPATAMVVMNIDGQPYKYADFGEGTVDAVFNTICHIAGFTPKLEEYSVSSITGGTDALGEVTVRIENNGFSAMGRSADPDVIRASALAFINALNRLAKKQEEA